MPEVLGLARRSGWIVSENLGFAIADNLAAVPLAMAGFATPLLAAALMSCSSVIVVLNALRAGRAP